MTHLVKNGLEAGARVLQTTLQRARADMNSLRYCIDGRALACKSVLDRAALAPSFHDISDWLGRKSLNERHTAFEVSVNIKFCFS